MLQALSQIKAKALGVTYTMVKKETPKIPNIYLFNNYRFFLKDLFESHRGSGQSVFSYRSFSRLMGYASPNIMRMIVSGTRNLPEDKIDKLTKLIKLESRQAEFFRVLVLFTQTDELENKRKYFEQICLFKAHLEIKNLDHLSYQYFSQWYYPVIREMTTLASFKEDPHYIAKNLSPAITPEEAEEALIVLKKIGLLAPDERNRLKPAQKNIISDGEVGRISLVKFHQIMADKAKTSIDRTPVDFRELISVTVPVNYSKFEKTRKKLRQLAEELAVDLANTNSADAIYQLNFHFFNMTQIPASWPKPNKTEKPQ